MHKMMKISAGNGGNSSSASLSVNNSSDLLIKIFLCLPVKSLLVFKPVSKHWYSLISDPNFLRKHYALNYNKVSISGLYFLHRTPVQPTDEQHIPSYGMLLLDRKAKIKTNAVSFAIHLNERPAGGLYIDQSCNGLLLCHRPPDYYNRTRYIYNPSTRHYRMIPQPPPFLGKTDCSVFDWQFYLAFDPCKSLNNEIVFLWKNYPVNPYERQMAVYSSNTGLWRLCGSVMLDFEFRTCHCVFWNGYLNWIGRGRTLYYFNIVQQVLKSSRLSDKIQKHWGAQDYFGECMGHMYLMLREKVWPFNSTCIFEMEIDYSGWKPICQLELGGFANKNGMVTLPAYFRILKVVVEGDGDEDELKVLILFPGKDEIVSYDLKTNSFEEICDCHMDQFDQYSQAAYIGSLANV